MIIKNIQIFRPDKTFEQGSLAMKDGVIVSPELGEGDVIDGKGCYAIPGLIDIHFHGCKGQDICDGNIDAIRTIAEYEASIGVAAIAPATMTLPIETLEEVLKTAASYRDTQSENGAEFVGINMEGPFISKVKKGAQDAAYIIPPDQAVFERFQKAADGLVKYIGIAPEEKGSMKFVDALKDQVNVSLAHTNADYQTAKEAYDRGACHAVHLYNAMPPFTHREPGVVGAAYDSKHCMAELICDGVHIHPAVVRATFDLFGDDRIILISDSIRATGMPDGEYTLGGQVVRVTGNRARLVSDGALAGSATNLMECLKIAVKEMKIPLASAVACATLNPAKSLGIQDCYGTLEEGKTASLVLLNQNLDVEQVILRGKILD